MARLSMDSSPLNPIKAHIVFVRAMPPPVLNLMFRNIVQQQFPNSHREMRRLAKCVWLLFKR